MSAGYAARPRLVSTIYQSGASAASDEQTFSRIWRLSRDLWQIKGILAVSPAELPDGLRQQVEAWAIEQYGEPNARKG